MQQLEANAMTHYQTGRLIQAQGLMERVVEMRPKRSDYWCFLGVIRRRQGDRIAALVALQKAVEVDERNHPALRNLAEVLIESGKVGDGMALINALAELGRVRGSSAFEKRYIAKKAMEQQAIIKRVVEGALDEQVQSCSSSI
ncbi:MAG: tetratricopeptide repeat protein [Bradymonadaceae bacterium]